MERGGKNKIHYFFSTYAVLGTSASHIILVNP